MRYDVAIIGAGLSGLAAGIRLAHFDKRVAIFERHTVWGGLNSFYKKDGHHFDTGLHAITNWLRPGYKGPRVPLQRIYRQLRLRPEHFALEPQGFSQTAFPQATLSWDNGLERLTSEIAERFPGEVDGFVRLAKVCEAYPDPTAGAPRRSTRQVLREFIDSPLLTDMLLCPLLFYGSAEEDDVDFEQFIILFNSIYREGFCRPRGGIKPILKLLVKRFTEQGGHLRKGCGVSSIQVDKDRVSRLVLDDGSEVDADVVISSAGAVETTRLRSDRDPTADEDAIGKLSFVEAIHVLDRPPADFGHRAAIVFYSAKEQFEYRQPREAVDLTSGVICCPSNFDHAEPLDSHRLRVTHMAAWDQWFGLDEETYADKKARAIAASMEAVRPYTGDFSSYVTYTDGFTPRTVKRYTDHLRGLVYGSPHKKKDGRTDLDNLFVCGTDQGMVGVIGAMLSGIAVANAYGVR